MIPWLKWTFARAPALPVAWVLAHATVLLWKALDPRYVDEAQWIVDVILKPLHPLGANPLTPLTASNSARLTYGRSQTAGSDWDAAPKVCETMKPLACDV